MHFSVLNGGLERKAQIGDCALDEIFAISNLRWPQCLSLILARPGDQPFQGSAHRKLVLWIMPGVVFPSSIIAY